jgi:PAS domain S-box-containing protein
LSIEEALRREVQALQAKLDVAEQTLAALVGGEIDTVAAGGAPVLLRAAQEQLRANEQLLRAIFDGALDAMLIADNEGRYVDANPAACELFGSSREALIGRRIADFTDPGPSHADGWRTFLEVGSLRGEFPLIRTDGARRDLEYSAVANVLPGLHLSVLRDVTERRASDEALRQAEQRLLTVISNAPVILYAIDNNGIYTLHEGKGVESVGLRPGEIVGQSVFARQAATNGAESALRRALAGEEVSDSFDVGGRSFDCTLVPVRDPHGTITGITGVAFDVTARRQAETALRASETRFRALIELSHDVTALLDVYGGVLYISPAVERMLGRSPEEIQGTSLFDMVVSDDRRRFAAAIERALSSAALVTSIEVRGIHRDGSTRWFEATARNCFDDPAVHAFVTNFHDITDRKLADAKLLESRALVEDAQGVAHLGSWASGHAPDDRITWSAECARVFGREGVEPPTVNEFFQMVHPEDRAAVIAASAGAQSTGAPCVTEHRIVRPDGEVRWVFARASVAGSIAWTDETAKIGADGPRAASYAVVGIVQDITDRRRVENELRASEARYRRIVENTSEGVWIYDGAGLTIFMNGRMASMLGCAPLDAVGKPIFAFMDDAMVEAGRAMLARRRSGQSERGEFRLRRQDGSALWVALHADPLFDPSGSFEASLALVTDITERRAADQTRNLLASIVESSDDSMMGVSLDGTITSCNRGATTLYGYSAEETIGQPASLLEPADRKDEGTAIAARVARSSTCRPRRRRCP